MAFVLAAGPVALSCGSGDQPGEERSTGKPAAPEQKIAEPAGKTAPEPLPATWAALAEALPAADRPELAAGVEPRLAAQGKGELTLPLPGAQGSGETHTRHPWSMPDGHGSGIGVVRWVDPSWREVKIDLGVGICPHRGKRLVSDVSSSGLAVAHHSATEPAGDPNWFLHVNADANLGDKAGETLEYEWAVFSY
jgi:hypothetical protein